MKKHTHKWYETTLAVHGSGEYKSYACICGVWKIESGRNEQDFEIAPPIKFEYKKPLK